jgi:branched-chain amino acid aminotransferase
MADDKTENEKKDKGWHHPWGTVYLNGEFVPGEKAMVSVLDLGFVKGDAAFDVCRTVKHKPYKLVEHIERFYRNLKYMRMDPGLSTEEMKEICEKVLEKSLHLLNEIDEYWIFMRVTRGSNPYFPLNYVEGCTPTVVVYCVPINFKAYARQYMEGRRFITVTTKALPSECIDPRLKCGSRLHFMLGVIEAQEKDPEAHPLLLDINGSIAEPWGANIFMISGGKLFTPGKQQVLEGITRGTVLEIAGEQGIEVIESSDLKLYDLYTADEAFVTTTSYKILPICSVDGVKIGKKVPGDITGLLTKGMSKKIGVDLVGHAMSHLSEEERREFGY